jgi:hypothetical protein
MAQSVIHSPGSGRFTALMKLRSAMNVHDGIRHQDSPAR